MILCLCRDASNIVLDPLPVCPHCGVHYQATVRPPVSGVELVSATIRDQQAWANSAFTLAATYLVVNTLDIPASDLVIQYWVLQQTILSMIFVSARLQGIVNLLYRNSSGTVPFYLKLYFFCIVANGCVVLHLLAGFPSGEALYPMFWDW